MPLRTPAISDIVALISLCKLDTAFIVPLIYLSPYFFNPLRKIKSFFSETYIFAALFFPHGAALTCGVSHNSLYESRAKVLHTGNLLGSQY